MIREQLKEQYRKETDGKTYLLLEKTKDSFEEQMIRNAKPEGILPMVKAEETGSYKYEITGRKNLAMTFERVPMNAEQVQKVLQNILDILERGKEYLLSEDCFILLPEYIFLRIPEYEVTLCYYPEYRLPFSEQMGKLFEMLLNRVDYREEKAIALVYALYMQLQEPDMTLERLREKLSAQVRETGTPPVVSVKQKPKEVVPEPKEDPKKTTALREEAAPLKKRINFWERFRKEGGAKEVSSAQMPVLQTSYVMETPPEWGTQYTRVLSVKKAERCPMLVQERDGESVRLEKFPFYVGSLSGYMDYVIEKDTVSRFHAKFIKQGEEVFLTDLNSTNGTKVNGRCLNVQEQQKLSDGDVISFADVVYAFCLRDD